MARHQLIWLTQLKECFLTLPLLLKNKNQKLTLLNLIKKSFSFLSSSLLFSSCVLCCTELVFVLNKNKNYKVWRWWWSAWRVVVTMNDDENGVWWDKENMMVKCWSILLEQRGEPDKRMFEESAEVKERWEREWKVSMDWAKGYGVKCRQVLAMRREER